MKNIYNYIAQAKYYCKTNWLQSVSILNKAIEEMPNEKLLYTELAEIYANNKHFKKSIELLEKALQLDNDDFIRFKIGNYYLSLEENKLAFIYYNEIKNPFPEALYNKAIALKNLNKSSECIKLLKSVVNLKPDSPLPYFLLIEELLTRNSVDQALDYITISEQKFIDHTTLNYYKGVCYFYKNNYLKSYYELNKAAKSYKNSIHFIRIYAEVCKLIGKDNISIDYLLEAINTFPEIASIRLDLVKLLITNHRINEAKQHISKLKKIDFFSYSEAMNLLKTKRNVT